MTAEEAIQRLKDMPPTAKIVVRIGSKEREAYAIDLEMGEVVISGT